MNTDRAKHPDGMTPKLAASAEPVAWVAADTLHSPHPRCVSSLAYMSQLDREQGREYVPLYATPVAALRRARFESGYGGMSLRDAMAMSVHLPDGYSVKWGEALIGEQAPNSVEPVPVHIDWWMRVEAAYRYRMADAMLKAREGE